MRPDLIVAVAPVFDNASSFVHVGEPLQIQTLGTKTPVERFDVSILHWLSGLDKEHPYLILIRPQIEFVSGELGPVIRLDDLR